MIADASSGRESTGGRASSVSASRVKSRGSNRCAPCATHTGKWISDPFYVQRQSRALPTDLDENRATNVQNWSWLGSAQPHAPFERLGRWRCLISLVKDDPGSRTKSHQTPWLYGTRITSSINIAKGSSNPPRGDRLDEPNDRYRCRGEWPVVFLSVCMR
jgi:hypothetical protein